MKNVLMKSTLSAMLVCSPFVVGTAAYADGPDEVKAEQPSLVQGDFFYFAKTMVEKIKLALADNDLEKAKLLSEFAAERMAEAQVLLKDGKENLLQETLGTAASNLEEADEMVTEAEASKEEVEKVKVHIGHNIEALAKVLDKVENPKAKQAIAKKIEKSFAKIAKRIEKAEMKEAKHEKKEETEEHSLPATEDKNTLQVVETQTPEVSATTEEQPVQQPEIKETEQTSVPVKQEVEQQVQERRALHTEQKEAHKEMNKQQQAERKELYQKQKEAHKEMNKQQQAERKELHQKQKEEKKAAKHPENKPAEKQNK